MSNALRAPPFTPVEEDLVLAEMRAGATAMVGGSTCHTVYCWIDGAWMAQHFEWGPDGDSVISEGDLRQVIRSHPEVFVDAVRGPHVRALEVALAADDRAAARDALARWLAWGDRQDRGRMLRAFLAWPGEAPDADTMAFLSRAVVGIEPWHAWMNATGWEKSADNARRGAAFVATLREICGHPPGSSYSEVSFLQLAGDKAAAARCLDADLARLAPDHPLRPALVERRSAIPG